ncbi:hypothetical protein [Epilithonimonas caeni]|uniref:hypothetical protein n=1 Tax=Epilithonimonas caeni TaxID=365343 RepID=UPI0004217F6E|nr:hypothetical protein [Epilithonimonas caeni]
MRKNTLLMQIDNPTHHNAKKEKIKALKALEVAKALNRKPVYLSKGHSMDFEKYKKNLRKK